MIQALRKTLEFYERLNNLNMWPRDSTLGDIAKRIQKLYSQKNVYTNIHNRSIYKSQKVEPT